MVKNSGLYPSVVVKSGDVPAVGLAGARLLTETIRVTSLDASLSKALSSWRGSWAVHDPGKIMADLAVCVALGGRCLSDVALLRCRGGRSSGRWPPTPQSVGWWGPWPTTSRRSRLS